MRLIDADALCRHLSDWQYGEMTDGKHDTEYGIIENVIEDIQKAPTIDAVPVIRCKDCKHHGEQYGNGYCMKDGCYGWDDEDYCSRAERKDDEPER